MFCFKKTLWLKVRNIPKNHTSWYGATDRLLGYWEIGDSSNDSNVWGIRFVGLPFSKFMFSN